MYYWKTILLVLSHFQNSSTMSYVLIHMIPSHTLAFTYLIPILILSLYPHCGCPIYFLHWGFKTKGFVIFTCFKISPHIWSEHTSSCLQRPELESEDILGVISNFSAYSYFRAYAGHTELFLKSTVLYVMTAHHGYRKEQHTVPLEEVKLLFFPAKLRQFVLVVRVVGLSLL